jgi:hypothetical protein
MSVPPIADKDKLTVLELEHLIGIMRAAKARMVAERIALEERTRASVDGHIQEALLAVTNELYLMTEIIRKLWLLRGTRP